MCIEKEVIALIAFLSFADIDQENAVANTFTEELSNDNGSESFLSILSFNRFCMFIFFRIC